MRRSHQGTSVKGDNNSDITGDHSVGEGSRENRRFWAQLVATAIRRVGVVVVLVMAVVWFEEYCEFFYRVSHCCYQQWFWSIVA